jgi:hypothetical protein
MQIHPVPRLAEQLLSDWAEELSQRLSRPVEQIRSQGLGASDFPTGESLHIKLIDGSFVQFEYAFHVVNPAKFAIAVFTEHCGYHLFPFHEAVVSRVVSETLYIQAS